jgi:hypothetical protein
VLPRHRLQSLEHQLPILQARREGEEMYGAPRLPLFDLMRPNENALSRIIADLLDPLGTHGQGFLLLNALLRRLGLPTAGFRDVVRVAREVQTDARRRIDIVVTTPSVLLGIENKPTAGQLPNQLADYYRALESRAKGRQFALVFLSDQKEESAEGKVIRLPYCAPLPEPSLYAVLSSTVGLIRAFPARAHVEDFMRYIN